MICSGKKLGTLILLDKMRISDFRSLGFPHRSVSKESACNAGDAGSIPGLGRSPGEGNGNPLQYSCLENPIDRGAWRATVHGVAKSRTWLTTELLLRSLCFLRGLPGSASGKETCLPEQETQETWVPSLGQEDPYSSILAWRIPWTEEPGGLQSIGLQRVGHDWSHLV